MVGSITVLGLTCFIAPPVAADPVAPPSTSEEAKRAWVAAGEQAGALNEAVLQAQLDEQAAKDSATAAAGQVTSSRDAATAALTRSADADGVVASYQVKVNKFANASFRGARLNQFSALLTADSAEEFLDEVTSLDRVAADTQQTLAEAIAAKAAARQAKADADTAAAAAAEAKLAADAAQVAATQAATDVAAQRAALEAQAAEYQRLYETLSEQERQAAIEAAERAREEAAARAAAAEEAAREEAASAEAEAEESAAAELAARAPAAADRADRTSDAEAVEDTTESSAARSSTAESSAAAAEPAAPQAASGGSSAGQAAANYALSKVGSPYVYGAAGPNSFDCSGLTSWAWAQAGVTIPRTSRAQSGLPSVPLDQLQPGDLVTYYSPVSHVAMYIGDGQIVHASTSSKPVYVTSMTGAGPNPSGHRPG